MIGASASLESNALMACLTLFAFDVRSGGNGSPAARHIRVNVHHQLVVGYLRQVADWHCWES